MITIRGGKKHHRDIAQITIDWAISRLGLLDRSFEIALVIQPLDGYCGECVPGKDTQRPRYHIKINPNQSLRNFIGTIVHEMIHVRQYLEGEWTQDGERECGELEMLLTDELWRQGLI
jgi:hypothetical protein